MKAILIIDHGSKRDEANHMLACMANLVQAMAGDAIVVDYAHMELAEPTIPQGFAACVERGATEVVAFPYMLSPGKHSTADIPRLVAEAAERFPHVPFTVTPAFGVHEKLAELILLRAGTAPARTLDRAAAARCWAPEGFAGCCGGACRATPQAASLPDTPAAV